MHWRWMDALLQDTEGIATVVATVHFSEKFLENGLQIIEFEEQGRGGCIFEPFK